MIQSELFVNPIDQFICCVVGQEPQIQKLWDFAKDGITHEVHPFAHINVGDFSGDFFQTNYSTEVGHRVALYGQISINGSVEWLGMLAPFCGPGWLGLRISWFPKRAVDTELGLEPGLGELNLEFSSDLTSRGVERSLPVRLTFPGIRKMCAPVHAASVMLAFRSTVWSGLRISCAPTRLAVKSGLIGPMTTGMIFGTNRLINNLCVNFPLVV